MLFRWYSFFVLNLLFYVSNAVIAVNIQCYCFPSQGFDENLHSHGAKWSASSKMNVWKKFETSFGYDIDGTNVNRIKTEDCCNLKLYSVEKYILFDCTTTLIHRPFSIKQIIKHSFSRNMTSSHLKLAMINHHLSHKIKGTKKSFAFFLNFFIT